MKYDDSLDDMHWHVSYLKKKENDPRRHKARCQHYARGYCGVLAGRCIGSSHCDHYIEIAEYIAMEERFRQNNEAEERASEIKEKYIEKRKKFMEEHSEEELVEKYGKSRICPVCKTKMPKNECSYCGFNINKN